ncbi:hypothetical protein ALCH109712_00805 [Alkalicoccus chagannorensis]
MIPPNPDPTTSTSVLISDVNRASAPAALPPLQLTVCSSSIDCVCLHYAIERSRMQKYTSAIMYSAPCCVKRDWLAGRIPSSKCRWGTTSSGPPSPSKRRKGSSFPLASRQRSENHISRISMLLPALTDESLCWDCICLLMSTVMKKVSVSQNPFSKRADCMLRMARLQLLFPLHRRSP